MKIIKFLDLSYLYKINKKEIDEAYFKVMDSGHYIKGKELELFEEEFAKHAGANYCIGVANGLDAISLSLKALDIGPGDEVIVPSFTFIATWLAVSSVGAIPIPVDININTYNIDTTKIEEKISKKTKAILGVNLYGLPCDYTQILNICTKYNLYFVADAAQSHGALYENNKIGSYAHLTCYSFYPGKNLGAFGDGGAVVTNDKNLSNKIRKIANYGSEKKYFHDYQGVNSRLDELQAAFLRVKLIHLDDWNKIRNTQANIYKQELDTKFIKIQNIDNNKVSSYHLFVISTNLRNELQKYLSSKNIETIIHYPIPIYKSKAYENFNIKLDDHLNSEQAYNSVLSLPIGPHLNDDDIQYIASHVNLFFHN